MLTQETKRKIDSARDILVGKVPDPKAQVEQITTALIYKFMDDMDKDAVEMGGAERFFSNGYEKYAWTKVMDSRLSGQERLNLYTEALTKLAHNPHIPQLFRDIFKDAFLPYRNPETLSLFLKEVNGFMYKHSEDLGDAFEYLLSIMGSQGDAGQFRTPRHIIDFIVAVVDPKKDETICDPACGTAGFLISAYKHIIRENDGVDEKGVANTERPLSPDEKSKMMNNLTGYDISPDMVRLSKVNMYLHGFADPKIYEYDTLSSEEKWDETFDVMLANPPFMTPKGGIKPHKRFGVQANRAEVLFVDYIKEHLHPNGRAGIIVPEGIIFKSDVAYKALRKALIEDGLFAVVSLPPGVFNPYSPVKTAILFFDNALAKRAKDILFIKIENDGRDLGAQRRIIEKNDIPIVTVILNDYKKTISSGEGSLGDVGKFIKHFDFDHSRVNIVAKEKITQSGDYNLSADKYREVEELINQKWPAVALGDILEYEQPTKYIVNSVEYDDKYKTPVLTAGKTFILGHTNEKEGIFQKGLPVIIFDDFTTAIKLVDFPFKVKSSAMKILQAKKDMVDIKFAFYSMQRIAFMAGQHKRYWISEYSKIKITLPPLDVQKEIVKQIEVKQDAIDHARAVINDLERERLYFGRALGKLNDIKVLPLGDICKNMDSKRKPVTKSDRSTGKYPYYGASGVVDYVDDYIFDGNYLLVSEDGANLLARSTPIAFSVSGKTWVNNHAHILDFKHLETQKFVEYYLNGIDLKRYITGTAQPKLNQENLNKIQIPIPTLEIQRQMVDGMEKEKEIIASNRKLIEVMENKIQGVLAGV